MRASALARQLAPLALAAAGGVPVGLAAQSAGPVAVGAAVRVMAPPPNAWREGRVAALGDGMLVLDRRQRGGVGRADTIPLAAVRRLEVRRGPRPVVLGLIGGILGAYLGGALAVAAAPADENTMLPALTMPAGAVAGYVLGVRIGTVRRWKPVAVPAPAGGGGR